MSYAYILNSAPWVAPKSTTSKTVFNTEYQKLANLHTRPYDSEEVDEDKDISDEHLDILLCESNVSVLSKSPAY